MERKEKIVIIIFFLALGVSVAVSFLKFVVFKDYYVQFQSECNPEAESCFVYECDPEEDETCDPEEEPSYYKLIKKKAYLVDGCGEEGKLECFQIKCTPGEKCEETLCDEQNLEEGEVCTNPETYLEEQLDAKEPETVEDIVESEEDLPEEDASLIEDDVDSVLENEMMETESAEEGLPEVPENELTPGAE